MAARKLRVRRRLPRLQGEARHKRRPARRAGARLLRRRSAGLDQRRAHHGGRRGRAHRAVQARQPGGLAPKSRRGGLPRRGAARGRRPRGARRDPARELLEETGYAATELLFLGKTRPNPAIQENWIHTFLARGVEFRSEPVFGGTEQTVVRLAPLAEIPSLISEGKITHALVVVGFHWLALAGQTFVGRGVET